MLPTFLCLADIQRAVRRRTALLHAFLHFPNYVQKGFEERCTYQLSADQQQVSKLTSLAAFAHYAGVGYKTSMGMGQVRVEFGNGPPG